MKTCSYACSGKLLAFDSKDRHVKQSTRARRRTPQDFVTVFDDFSGHSRPVEPDVEVVTEQPGRKGNEAGKTPQHAEWSVKPAKMTEGADVSIELTEEEEQHYLQQLEQKKAAKERKKREAKQESKYQASAGMLDASKSTKQQSCRDQSSHELVAGTSTCTPDLTAASQATGPAIVDGSQQAKPTRKFRVLPTVAAVQAAPSSSAVISPQIEPRILEVKVVAKSECIASVQSPMEHRSQQDESVLSPFSAFYYETTGLKKIECADVPQKLEADSKQFDVVDNASNGDKSVHFASAPQSEKSDLHDRLCQQEATAVSKSPFSTTAGEEPTGGQTGHVTSPTTASRHSRSPSTDSSHSRQGQASSRELSLAPKAQRIWPLESQFSAANIEESSHTSMSQEVPSLTTAHELVRQSSLSVVHALKDIDAYKEGLQHEMLTSDTNCDSTVLPVKSPKANSWSGIGVKLEPVRCSSFRSCDPALLGGLEVIEMDLGGPAERSGIKVGDVIVHLSNGVLPRGTSAMEATSILRQQAYPHHVIVSRRQTSWAKQGALNKNQGNERDGARKLISLCIQRPDSDAAFGTDLSSGFTLRDCKQDQQEKWSNLPMVSDLMDGSSAHKSGLRIGDVLIGVGSLRVCKMPARASISLLLGETGSQVLLGIYHMPAADGSSQNDGQAFGTEDRVKWSLVERMSGCHVSLEASQAISPKLGDPRALEEPLLPELSPEDSLERKRLSPSSAFAPDTKNENAEKSSGAVGALSLSPVPSNVSNETYFAYRDTTASSSVVASPDGVVPSGDAHAAACWHRAGAIRAAPLDESLEELRRQARAREKRQAFLAHEVGVSAPGRRANPQKYTPKVGEALGRTTNMAAMHLRVPHELDKLQHARSDGNAKQAPAATKPAQADR